MRRFPRKSQTVGCVIPRTAIAWLILTMATITILSLILIEVRRIINSKHDNDSKDSSSFFPNKSSDHLLFNDASTGEPVSIPTELTYLEVAEPNVERAPDREDEVVFGSKPFCLESPFLLILVTSSPENFRRRDGIRKTWAERAKWRVVKVPKLKWRTIFLVGRHPINFVNTLIQKERVISGDILIGKHLDTYRNLTLKVVYGLKWAAQNCQPDFVLKTDDDCFVNAPLLVEFLSQFRPLPTNIYAGTVRWLAPVHQQPLSSQYVSRLQRPKPQYAPYTSGDYILSKDVLEKLTVLSDQVPVFPNEDAYIGTVLRLAGIEPTHSPRFATKPGQWELCSYQHWFVTHGVNSSSEQSVQQEMANKAAEECSDSKNLTIWVP